jgi:hypothetical protein
MSTSPSFGHLAGQGEAIKHMADRHSYLKRIFENVNLVISPSRFLIQKVIDYGLNPKRIIHSSYLTVCHKTG